MTNKGNNQTLEGTRAVLGFSIDAKFAPHLAAALESLIANNNTAVDVYVIDFGLTNEMRLTFNNQVRGCINKIIFIQIDENRYLHLPTNGHFSLAMFGRIFLPEEIRDAETLIYVDADVIFMKDIKPLMEIDNHIFPLAAVTNIDSQAMSKLTGRRSEYGYLDSGLLIIKLKEWRDTGMTEKIIDILNQKTDWALPDNDAINMAVMGNYFPLPRYFSYQTHYLHSHPETAEDAEHAIILQYAGPIKPNSFLSEDPFKSYYRRYLAKTSYRKILWEDKNPSGVLRIIKRNIRGIIDK